jgi:hypothetical protein
LTDKGKGREVSSARSVGQEASLGKRKRPLDDEGGVEAKVESTTSTGEMSAAKRRRRRRKKLQEASTGTLQGDNSET